MSDDLFKMFSYQIEERNKEISDIEEKIARLDKQKEILIITKKLKFFEIDVLHEQKVEYKEKYL